MPLIDVSLAFNPIVIIPTYNNARTLPDVLQRLQVFDLPIIVVNDGATDGTSQILNSWQTASCATALRYVFHHPYNMGKAAALQSGFSRAMASGYTHAVTIDSDGQLDPEQIPDFLAIARRYPNSIILGCRDAKKSDYPLKSRLGRGFSNLMVWLESGCRVSDSQCGFRLYPLACIKSVRCKTGRYGYETEVITRAAWNGFQVQEIPVRCRYFPKEKRISHFRPGLDTWQAILMHARLLITGFPCRLNQTRYRLIRPSHQNASPDLSINLVIPPVTDEIPFDE